VDGCEPSQKIGALTHCVVSLTHSCCCKHQAVKLLESDSKLGLTASNLLETRVTSGERGAIVL
jgi:hypothetical protein